MILADDFIHGVSILKEMIEVYNTTNGANVLAVMDVPREHVSRYGIVTPVSESSGQFF